MSNYIEPLGWLVIGAGMIGQAVSPGDWTHFASLPFAFAAASFLIWSIVGLLRMVFEAWKKQSEDTLLTLRGQVARLQTSQDDVLLKMVERASTVIERDVEAASSAVLAWKEVHTDFRDLISELRACSCLRESNVDRMQRKTRGDV